MEFGVGLLGQGWGLAYCHAVHGRITFSSLCVGSGCGDQGATVRQARQFDPQQCCFSVGFSSNAKCCAHPFHVFSFAMYSFICTLQSCLSTGIHLPHLRIGLFVAWPRTILCFAVLNPFFCLTAEAWLNARK